jgi:hypothetical protein
VNRSSTRSLRYKGVLKILSVALLLCSLVYTVPAQAQDLVKFSYSISGTIHDADFGFWDEDEEENYLWQGTPELMRGGHQ